MVSLSRVRSSRRGVRKLSGRLCAPEGRGGRDSREGRGGVGGSRVSGIPGLTYPSEDEGLTGLSLPDSPVSLHGSCQ